MIAFERLLLLLLLALDWAADPARLAPAVQPLAKPWCSTENVCPSGGYQRVVLQRSLPDHNSGQIDPAVPSAASECTADAADMHPATIPVCHLYVFLSLRR
jgi:hypothetical protein